jgi:hypothetical protein
MELDAEVLGALLRGRHPAQRFVRSDVVVHV